MVEVKADSRRGIDMHPLAKKLLIARQLKFEEGEITVLGGQNVLLSTDTIIEMTMNFPKEKIYSLGKNGGTTMALNLKKTGLSSRKLGEFAMELFSMDGWGNFNVLQMSNSKITIHVQNSSIAKKINLKASHVKEPQCFFLSGMLAGIWATALEKKIESKETKCLAAGHPICEFTLS